MGALAMTKAPCAKCPFRMDVPIYLRAARRSEIAASLLRGETFPCHATVEHDEEGDACGGEWTPCSGAEKALMAVGQTTQMARISARLGLLDLDGVAERGAECWDLNTWQSLPEGATEGCEPEEVATCSVVDPGCLAPAGFLVGGGVQMGTEPADDECRVCGEPVCSNCLRADGCCATCTEVDDEEAAS